MNTSPLSNDNPLSREMTSRDYWMKKFSGTLNKTSFPYDPVLKNDNGDYLCLDFTLEEDLYSTLMRISNKSDVRLHIIFVALWLMLLHKYTGHTDVVTGMPTYKQDTEGQLINRALALRSEVTGHMTVKELLLQVGQTLLEAGKYQDYPVKTLAYKLNLPSSGTSFPLFQVSVMLEGLFDRSYLNDIPQDMIVSFRTVPGSMQGRLEYTPSLYREETVKRHICHFREITRNALTDVSRPINEVVFLPQEEKQLILNQFNDNSAYFPLDRILPGIVADYAAKTPGRVALVYGDQHCTYEGLYQAFNYRARSFKALGFSGGQIASLLLKRGVWMVECILALWAAGGAYIPLEPHAPSERRDLMLTDSKTSLLLTCREFYPHDQSEGGYRGPVIYIDDDTIPLEDLGPHSGFCCQAKGEDLAYVIYTSGSTGKPKGAMVEHRGMMNHLQSKVNTLDMDASSVVAQNASQTFDISVWQFFAAFFQGGRTAIYSDDLILDPLTFISRLVAQGVSILEVVPSYLSVLLDFLINDRGGVTGEFSRVLHYLLVTGEEVKPHLVARWFSMFSHIKMVNAYGPTEASDDITHHVMDCDPGGERIPIGKPVQNFNIYIVDRSMNLCPIGVKGEILVSGVGVGRGYLHDPVKTGEVFMDDPFMEEKGRRLYKTGDLGRWLPNGSIEFFGRVDHQVKIRGFRIEPGEVENHLVRHPAIKEALVVDALDGEGEKFLCAYYVGEQGYGSVPGIREFLNRSLPDYMVPANFIILEKFPLNANGKVDRNALPDPLGEKEQARKMGYLSKLDMDRLASTINTLPTTVTGQMAALTGRSRDLNEIENQQLLVALNQETSDYPHRQTLHRRFSDQVTASPDHIALTGYAGQNSPWTGEMQLTYNELEKRSDKLALYLRERGIGAGHIVALLAQRSPALIIGILSVLKLGAAYLALNYTDPEIRISHICRDSRAAAILTDHTRPLSTLEESVRVDVIDLNAGDNDNREGRLVVHESDARGVAAVFYTSGSTGIPKGVILEHRGLVNRLHWMQQQFPLVKDDQLLQKTSVIFDVSMWELFGWFFGGASLCLLPSGQGGEPGEIVAAILRYRITHIHFIPAALIPFLSHLESTGTYRELTLLKRVYASGEALGSDSVDRFNRLLHENNGTHLYNLYGPTEASIEVTCHSCSHQSGLKVIPIGKPIANVRIHILDWDLALQPPGETGQLCIGGVAPARGYLNDPGATVLKFLEGANWRELPDLDEERLYLTGDLARLQTNGDIEFLGRLDRQVQIQGIRIEPGEIEKSLLQYSDVALAAVVARGEEEGNIGLFAFVKGPVDPGLPGLRERLAGKIPHYMIPSRFIELEAMPLTGGGKIDRELLRRIPIKEQGSGNFAPPGTEMEQQIAAIWKEVLNKERVGIQDNFFDMGGNSLGIIQVNQKMKEVFKRDVPPLVMFEHSTIASLIDFMGKQGQGTDSHDFGSATTGIRDRSLEKSKGKERMKQRRMKSRAPEVAKEKPGE